MSKRSIRPRLQSMSLLIGLIALAVSGCQLFGPSVSDADLKRVERPQIQTWQQGEGGVVMLDVRSAAAYQRAHIPGALHRPLPTLRSQAPELTGKKKRLVVYGQDAQDSLAAAAAKKLLSQGYQNIFVLRGGLKGWRQAGGAVTTPSGNES